MRAGNGFVRLVLMVVLTVAVSMVISGCESGRAPEKVLVLLDDVKNGYINEDMNLFLQNFAPDKRTAYHENKYLQVILKLKDTKGAWISEKYKGNRGNEYRWKITFAEGKTRLVLKVNAENQLVDAWFQ